MKHTIVKDLFVPIILAFLLAILYLLIPAYRDAGWRLYDLSLLAKPGIPQAPEFVIANIDDGTIEALNMYPLSRDIIARGVVTMAEFGATVLGIDSEFLDASPRVVREDYFRTELPLYFDDSFDGLANVTDQLLRAILLGGSYGPDDIEGLLDDFWSYKDYQKESLYTRVSSAIQDNDVYLGQAGRFFGRAYATVSPSEAQGYRLGDEHLDFLADRVALRNVAIPPEGHPFPKVPFVSSSIFPVLRGMAGGGSVVQHIDPDGVRRRLDLFFEFDGRLYPHLSLAVLLDWLGNPRVWIHKNSIVLVDALHPVLGKRDIRIPLDQDGRFIIHWPKGGFMENFRKLSFLRLWLDHEDFLSVNANLGILDSLGVLALYDGPVNLLDLLPLADEALKQGMDTGERRLVDEYRQLRRFYLDEVEAFLSGPVRAEAEAYYEDYLTDPTLVPATAGQVAQNLASLRLAFDESLSTLGRIRENRAVLQKELEGAIVVLGYSGKSTTDVGVNPFEKEYMNVGTFPSVWNTIYQDSYISDRPWWFSFLFILPFGLLIPVLFHWFSPGKGLAASAILLVLLMAAFFGIFVRFGVYLDQLMVLSYMLPTILAILIVNFRRTNSQKAFITDAFGQYLSEDVINDLILDPEKLQLGGEERVMTAMFTDVKGFSTISEALTPSALVHLLNEYLSAMSDQVLDQRGTIDKFEGDAIIAFFGAPIALEDHAIRACDAALRMRRIEEELNRRFMDEGLSPSPLLTRFGINTGSMVVGNMGTQRKKNYTIMGSAVNLAARLEGVNKQYGTWILLSGGTYTQLGGAFLCRRLDRVRVVGIHEPVQLYELLARKDQADPATMEKAERFEAALRLFDGHSWEKAAKAFAGCAKADTQDVTSRLYYKRSVEFMKKPLPESWDGVFTLATK
jgi:adenylate cyclase